MICPGDGDSSWKHEIIPDEVTFFEDDVMKRALALPWDELAAL